MSDEEQKTLVVDITQEPQSQNGPEGQPKNIKRGGALSTIRTKISEEELKDNVAAMRLVVERNYQLADEVEDLEEYRDNYYQKKEEAAVLNEKLNSLNSKQILSSSGGVLVGLAPAIWDKAGGLMALVVLIVGVVFLLVGFLKKN